MVVPPPPRSPRKVLVLLLVLVVLLTLVAVLAPFIANPTSVTQAYDSVGIFAPLLFVLLVMLAPTPGAIIGVSGGAYFGLWQGALLLFIGNLLGIMITFWLVRFFGRPAARRFFREDKLKQTDKFLSAHPVMQWIVYAIPIFPLELMTFVIALSDRSTKRFFITVATALPFYALLVTFVGSSLAGPYRTAFDYASIAIMIILVLVIVHVLYTWKRAAIHDTGRKIAKSVADGVDSMERGVSHVQKRMHRNMRKVQRLTHRRR